MISSYVVGPGEHSLHLASGIPCSSLLLSNFHRLRFRLEQLFGYLEFGTFASLVSGGVLSTNSKLVGKCALLFVRAFGMEGWRKERVS